MGLCNEYNLILLNTLKWAQTEMMTVSPTSIKSKPPNNFLIGQVLDEIYILNILTLGNILDNELG